MRTLGVDTATSTASVAIIEDGLLVAEKIIPRGASVNSSRFRSNHAEILLPLIASVLQTSALSLAELSALADAPTDGSIIVSVSATIGTVLTMASFSIHFSPAGFPGRFSTGRHLAAQHGLKVARQPTPRSSLQPYQAPRIRPQIRIRQTRHGAPAATPRNHRVV